MKLLIGHNFWTDLYLRLENCKSEIKIQFMTFEGDETGLKLANKLIELSKRNIKIQVLIDCFTDAFVSDTLWFKSSVKDEVIATKRMINDMTLAGIEVKRTHPYGFLGLNFLARNHKKIVVIDDYAYLGGINVSDHNKEWFDFMIGISKESKVKTVKSDFESTFSGTETNFSENNIYTTKKLVEKYYDLIKNAKEEIIISSPYILDRSLLKTLRINKNIHKEIYTLKQSNTGVLNLSSPYMLRKIIKNNADVYFFKQFSHAKFLLIDRKYLLVGSSNFDKLSFSLLQEIGLLIEDKKFIDDFYKKIIEEQEFEKAKKAKRNLLSNLLNYMISYFISLNSIIVHNKVLK
jgi:cardiolipin synthase